VPRRLQTLRNVIARSPDRIQAAMDEGAFSCARGAAAACHSPPGAPWECPAPPWVQAQSSDCLPRIPPHRPPHTAGFEQLLQDAYVRHLGCRDVAFACLRDMGVSYAETDVGREQAARAARAIAAGDISVK
jgi:hypothetical protein